MNDFVWFYCGWVSGGFFAIMLIYVFAKGFYNHE